MKKNYAFANGWGMYEGKLVYLPLWDPSPISQTGLDLLAMIVIKQNLQLIKNVAIISSFEKILKQRTSSLISKINSASFNPIDDDWCPTKPKTFPPKRRFWVQSNADLNKIFGTNDLTLFAKNNLLQLGTILNDSEILIEANRL